MVRFTDYLAAVAAKKPHNPLCTRIEAVEDTFMAKAVLSH